MARADRRLLIIAGPNGAGKTTPGMNPCCSIGDHVMNDKPIAQSADADLRGSLAALQRAAARARERARTTGTRLVVSRKGVVQYLEVRSSRVAEQDATYKRDA